YDANTPEGNIIRTIPAANSDVTPSTDEKEGSMITLYVSKGAEPKETEPPQTEPPQTDPPQTEPVATEPPQTEPTETEPTETTTPGT
ncbi:MAG: PASTA domain-containing protein, partial [Clostridia bacterium]|nr:PASTA domain-containing protein [Clostridia bacterium]